MRRYWLTLLTVFAFVASGVVGASAMSVCPMRATAEAATPAHDCCPDNKPANQAPDHRQPDCMMGPGCRAASVAAPMPAPVQFTGALVALDQPVRGEAAPPRGPLQELWRPPRTI